MKSTRLVVEHRALRQVEGRARRDRIDVEELEIDAHPPMVAALRLLEPRQVLLELRLAGEGRAVDALEHRVALVAPPVGARDLEQLERADLVGALHVRPAAQVGEVAVPEDRDLLALGDVVDARNLELLAPLREERSASSRSITSQREDALLGQDLPHLLLDLLEILGREGALHEEVVLELLRVVGASDVDLRGGNRRFTASAITCSAEWRITSAACGIPGGDDLEAASSRRGVRRSTSRPSMRPARAARASRCRLFGNGEDRRTRGHRQRLAIRQADLDFAHDAGGSCESVLLRCVLVLVGTGGIEPPTSAVSRRRSPTELRA